MTIRDLTSSRSGAAAAVLGETPLVTLSDDGDSGCLTVRLKRAGEVYLGVIDDRARIVERVRFGLGPRVWLHADDGLWEGEARARVLGRSRDLEERLGLVGRAGAVVLELRPTPSFSRSDELVGAVPRT